MSSQKHFEVITNMSYLYIKGNKIFSYTCEINIVHHCNLSCRGCGHLSPIAKRKYVEPQDLFEQLSILAKFYQAEHVRLLGGEPLLHPQLNDILKVVKASGISSKIRIVTNGVLLAKMPSWFWQEVDEVHISIYPTKEFSGEILKIVESRAQEFNVTLEILNFSYFRESYSELGTDNKVLIKQIYDTCQMAHDWRCFNVEDGYFYKCPEGHFLPLLLSQNDSLAKTKNGIKIEDSHSFFHELLEYIKSPDPLPACSFCLGSVGKKFKHIQVSRKNWRNYQKLTTEELIDYDYLKLLEANPEADNGCVSPE